MENSVAESFSDANTIVKLIISVLYEHKKRSVSWTDERLPFFLFLQ